MKLKEFTSDQLLIQKGNKANSTQFVVWADKNGFESGRNNTVSVIVSSSPTSIYRFEGPNNLITDTNWHHISIAFDGSISEKIKVYFDGSYQNIPAVFSGNVTQLKKIRQMI